MPRLLLVLLHIGLNININPSPAWHILAVSVALADCAVALLILPLPLMAADRLCAAAPRACEELVQRVFFGCALSPRLGAGVLDVEVWEEDEVAGTW